MEKTSTKSLGAFSAGGGSYVLPPATSETLGGVKIGAGLSATEDGTLSATGGDVSNKADKDLGNITQAAQVPIASALNGILKTETYQRIGKPTVTNGIASGFSVTNYFKIPISDPKIFDNDFEIFTKVTLPESYSSAYILGTGDWATTGFLSDASGALVCWTAGETDGVYGLNQIACPVGTVAGGATVYLKQTKTGSTVTFTIYDASKQVLFTGNTSLGDTFVPSNVSEYRIGYGNSGAFGGSIDLNETYIKVNDTYFFIGQATPPMVGETEIVAFTDFSASGCLEAANVFSDIPTSNKWEIILHVKTPSNVSLENIPLFCSFAGAPYGGFEISIRYGQLNVVIITTSGTLPVNTYFGTLSASSEYWIKLYYDNSLTYPYNAVIATDKNFTQNVQSENFIGQAQGITGEGINARLGHYADPAATQNFSDGIIYAPDCKVTADDNVIFDGADTTQYSVEGSLTSITEKHTKGAAYVVESYRYGSSWYRIWSDGWCEQGGQTAALAADGYATITYLKPFVDTNYNLTQSLILPSGANTQESVGITDMTTTGCKLWAWSSRAIVWKAEGYIL